MTYVSPTELQGERAESASSLSRVESVAPYLVTTAPDVATSTNLAGFINRAGVFSPPDRPSVVG
jgi:pyruvate dehydrogenase E1 component